MKLGRGRRSNLRSFKKYGPAYTNAFSGKGRTLKRYYIDGFSGAGVHLSKQSKGVIEGSPARALKVTPPFDGFTFIDMNADKTEYLRQQCAGRSDNTIFTGDANEHLIKDVLPRIQYELYTRALCLLDPTACIWIGR
jgi:three-Cys-motif partner protein